MNTNYRLRLKVRKSFVSNPNQSIYSIAKDFNISPNYVSELLENKELDVVKSLTESNVYFLFTEILEKKILTTPENIILNGFDFSQKEKDYLKTFGFKFRV